MDKNIIKSKIIKELKPILNKLGIEKDDLLIEPKVKADFASNVALGNKGKNPMELAKKIVKELEPKLTSLGLKSVEIATPGFLNFYIDDQTIIKSLNQIIKQNENFGRGKLKGNLNIEWVSANPTGYLHIGHARNAAIGSALYNICTFAGLSVLREYYINDGGNQINTLAQSIFARYKQFYEPDFPMPEDCYGGQDIVWNAEQIRTKHGDKFKDLKELNDEALKVFKKEGVANFLKQIKVDLKKFKCGFDIWFSEKTLYANNSKRILDTIKKLKNHFEADGSTWLRTTKYGDDKDRVVIKSNGDFTYFAPDIAYHDKKFKNSGKDPIIMNIWGADHLSYITRMKIAMQDLGYDPNKLIVLCLQLVRLMKDGQEYKMSKRKGTSFWLRDFVDLVGVDSARFILLDRTYNSKLDFDINIATSKSNDNPVFLIQYANARSYQLLKKSKLDVSKLKATNIDNELDKKLVSTLLEFPEVIISSATKYLTHLLTQYLIRVAKEFNSWYSNTEKIIGSKNEMNSLTIARAVNIVLENGLRLLGVSSKHKM